MSGTRTLAITGLMQFEFHDLECWENNTGLSFKRDGADLFAIATDIVSKSPKGLHGINSMLSDEANSAAYRDIFKMYHENRPDGQGIVRVYGVNKQDVKRFGYAAKAHGYKMRAALHMFFDWAVKTNDVEDFEAIVNTLKAYREKVTERDTCD